MTASNFNPPDRLTQTLLRDCLYENRDGTIFVPLLFEDFSTGTE